ncbi:hypothetical protein [Candidatus Chlamydia sanziniae]|nr:hypothetical protein [Candidatus Chlamydia sanziniae]
MPYIVHHAYSPHGELLNNTQKNKKPSRNNIMTNISTAIMDIGLGILVVLSFIAIPIITLPFLILITVIIICCTLIKLVQLILAILLLLFYKCR